MNEKLRELLEMALAERFDLAYAKMLEGDPVDADAALRLVRLSDELEHHPGISEDARKVLNAFHTADSDNNAQFQKYLYVQGAKDCVGVLRELDLIKSSE